MWLVALPGSMGVAAVLVLSTEFQTVKQEVQLHTAPAHGATTSQSSPAICRPSYLSPRACLLRLRACSATPATPPRVRPSVRQVKDSQYSAWAYLVAKGLIEIPWMLLLQFFSLLPAAYGIGGFQFSQFGNNWLCMTLQLYCFECGEQRISLAFPAPRPLPRDDTRHMMTVIRTSVAGLHSVSMGTMAGMLSYLTCASLIRLFFAKQRLIRTHTTLTQFPSPHPPRVTLDPHSVFMTSFQYSGVFVQPKVSSGGDARPS